MTGKNNGSDAFLWHANESKYFGADFFVIDVPSWTWQLIVIGLQGNAMRFYDLTNALLELEEFQQNHPLTLKRLLLHCCSDLFFAELWLPLFGIRGSM